MGELLEIQEYLPACCSWLLPHHSDPAGARVSHLVCTKPGVWPYLRILDLSLGLESWWAAGDTTVQTPEEGGGDKRSDCQIPLYTSATVKGKVGTRPRPLFLLLCVSAPARCLAQSFIGSSKYLRGNSKGGRVCFDSVPQRS